MRMSNEDEEWRRGGRRRMKERRGSEDELVARYRSTYVLSIVSGRQLMVLRGWVPEDIGLSTIRVVL
jgi:hypothetical protein